jgi:hypothetical protein
MLEVFIKGFGEKILPKAFCSGYSHRWACLLKKQLSIIVYCLPTKENKLPFSVSVCSKQTKIFCFQKTKGSFHFQLVLFSVCGNIEICTWIHEDMVTRRRGNGDMETLRHKHGDTDTWRKRDMETWTWRHGDIKWKTEAQVIFLYPFTLCSPCKRMVVVCPSVCKWTKLPKGTKQTCPSMVIAWMKFSRFPTGGNTAEMT